MERLYLALKQECSSTILPLLGDVADPSPGLGWLGRERLPLEERGSPDLVLALALVHHLVIGRTIPMHALVDWFAGLGGELVVELPDPEDEMVRRLLSRKREGAHPDYTRKEFELGAEVSLRDRRLGRVFRRVRAALDHAAPLR